MAFDIETAFDRFLREHHYPLSVIFTEDGRELISRGDVNGLPWRGLYDSLFGTRDAVVRLAASFVSRPAFQMFKQGKLRCVAFALDNQMLVGLFDQSGGDAAGSYRDAKATMNELITTLGSYKK